MARRGDELREHILWQAKDVFLEMGFERASMDVVAARAQTSKRSLYAHFESKEKLFLAVIEFVRSLFLRRLKMPGDYGTAPEDALVLFCGRYLETLLYGPSVRMCRVAMAEVSRFPQGASQYFDLMFTEVHERLSGYLRETFDLNEPTAAKASEQLLARVFHPRLPRALFGMDRLSDSFAAEGSAPNVDLAPIRQAVTETVDALRRLQER